MHVAVSLCLGLVDLVVVCGNIFVLYLLGSQPSLRSSTNSLVLSLTLSDLLLGVFILPFSIMQEHHGVWLYGERFCRAWLSLDVFFSTASIYNLLAISVDRYMAVSQPIRYPIISSKRVVRRMIAAVWIAAACVASGLLVVARSEKGEADPLCSPLSFPDPFILASASASFITPAVLMIVLNLLIFRKVHTSGRSKSFYLKRESGGSLRVHRGKSRAPDDEKKRLARQLMGRSEDSTTRNTNGKNTPTREGSHDGEYGRNGYGGRRSSGSTDSLTGGKYKDPVDFLNGQTHVNSHQVRTLFTNLLVVSLAHTKRRTDLFSGISKPRGMAPSLRTELRVARTTSVVVGAFVVCWFPFMTIYLLQTYSLCPFEQCVPAWLFTVTFWLGYANSALNPILYAAFSRDFRAAFRKVLLPHHTQHHSANSQRQYGLP